MLLERVDYRCFNTMYLFILCHVCVCIEIIIIIIIKDRTTHYTIIYNNNKNSNSLFFSPGVCVYVVFEKWSNMKKLCDHCLASCCLLVTIWKVCVCVWLCVKKHKYKRRFIVTLFNLSCKIKRKSFQNTFGT